MHLFRRQLVLAVTHPGPKVLRLEAEPAQILRADLFGGIRRHDVAALADRLLDVVGRAGTGAANHATIGIAGGFINRGLPVADLAGSAGGKAVAQHLRWGRRGLRVSRIPGGSIFVFRGVRRRSTARAESEHDRHQSGWIPVDGRERVRKWPALQGCSPVRRGAQ